MLFISIQVQVEVKKIGISYRKTKAYDQYLLHLYVVSINKIKLKPSFKTAKPFSTVLVKNTGKFNNGHFREYLRKFMEDFTNVSLEPVYTGGVCTWA